MYSKVIVKKGVLGSNVEVQEPTIWDLRFMEMAEVVASWSKDPSTKCGAVVTNDKHQVIGLGFNGFPRNFEDTPERLADREFKYKYVIHAEVNAILNCNSPVENATLYQVPMMSCSNCSAILIQTGIKRVVSRSIPLDKLDRWRDSMILGYNALLEAGVEIVFIDAIGTEYWNPTMDKM
jgi:dCMP deaminase